MRAHTLPAASGWRWLADGYAIYRRNPALLLLLVVFYWLTLILVNLVPLLGPVAASIAIPGLSVGLMNACRDLDDGRVPLPGALFSGFRDNRQALITLGILYLTLTMAILLLSTLVDGGELMRHLTSGKAPDKEAEGGLLAPLFVMLLLLPLVMAFWFGPMLAAWYRLSAPKALFFSLVACWLNWRAFLVYAVSMLLLAVVAPSILLFIVALFAPGATGVFGMLLAVPLLLVLMPVVFASFYVSYRDVFGVSERV